MHNRLRWIVRAIPIPERVITGIFRPTIAVVIVLLAPTDSWGQLTACSRGGALEQFALIVPQGDALTEFLSRAPEEVSPFSAHLAENEILSSWVELARSAEDACVSELGVRVSFEQLFRVEYQADMPGWETLNAIDAANAEFLREVFRSDPLGDEPPDSVVGAVLRLSLHTSDPSIMADALDWTPASSLAGPALTGVRLDYARLVDRHAVQTGQAQVYGTQRWVDGQCTRLFPVEDAANLTARRQAFGLAPLDRSRLCRAEDSP